MDVLINLGLVLVMNAGLAVSIIPVLGVYISRNKQSFEVCQNGRENQQINQVCQKVEGLIALYVLIVALGVVQQVIGWLLFSFRKSPPQQSPLKGINLHVYYQLLIRTFIALTCGLFLLFISLLAVYSDYPTERAIGITGFILHFVTISGSVFYCYSDNKNIKETGTESTLTLDTNQNTA